MADNKSTALPPLYKNPKPLIASEHRDLKIKPLKDFSFAKEVNSTIITLTEMPAAALNYPVVFAKSGNAVQPIAILGFDSNSMLDERGQWREGAYVPAYIRRYPFIFMQSEGSDILTLCVDMESASISNKDGESIFKDDEPTEVAKTALNFCEQYNRELSITTPICAAIEDAGLLEEKTVNVEQADQSKSALSGFLTVNEQKLNTLDDEAFMKLRSSGALPLIYSHLLSMRSWNNLLK